MLNVYGSKVFAQQKSQQLLSPIQIVSPSTEPEEGNRITIDIISSNLLSLTNAMNNQLKVVIKYKIKDSALVNTPINGVMKVLL